MIETVRTVIQQLAASHADFRVHLFDVQPVEDAVPASPANLIALRGRVLEPGDLDALHHALSASIPGATIDTSAVRVLRQPDNPVLAVGTNLTSLHREPSFLAEQLSQLVNGMTVERLAEEGRWCLARQNDGYLGWTYLPYLTHRSQPAPTHILVSPVEPLHCEPDGAAALLTRVLGGTTLSASGFSAGWVEVQLAGGLRGWLPETSLRPLEQLPVSGEARRTQILFDAARMTGVPYLWGGNTANGIDCSGLAQLAHRWLGLTIPRDADMQCAAGKPVEPPFRPGDLLFFGEKGEKGSITHVAISQGGWQIIHSSRSRNGVYSDDVQAVPHLRESFLQAATYLEDY